MDVTEYEDGTTSNGGFGKAFGRVLSGEKMFQNIYTAQCGPGMIAFAPVFQGLSAPFLLLREMTLSCRKKRFLPVKAA